MEQLLNKMKSLLLEYLPKDMALDSDIKGVKLVRRDKEYSSKPQIYNPEIIILAQGEKHVYVGNNKYDYDKNNYFVITVPLPVVCEAVIKPGEPMLGIVIEIDPQVIGEILYEMDVEAPKKTNMKDSLYKAKITEEMLEISIKLLKALKSKNDSKILGPIYLKELIYKILVGEHSDILKELAYNNRVLYQISRAINRIHEDYSQPIEIQSLADEAGMSISMFHKNFKMITKTSPLQYIKNIRLHKAKELIQERGEKVYEAAIQVGYESSSQFNREYRRLFGITPAKDTIENSFL